MERFAFESGRRRLALQQAAERAIGHKLYPGALLAAGVAEAALADDASGTGLASAIVVELGAGVCGLPSMVLAAAQSAASPAPRCLATDLPDVLPLLRLNVAAAGLAHAVEVAPLAWGDAADAAAVLRRVQAAAAAALRPAPTVFLGADVVYHEHLIEPLLRCLLQLTAESEWRRGGAAAGSPGSEPPVVLLTYVQRFKRAKAFWRQARRSFVVVEVPLGEVVDYEVLTWLLPRMCEVLGTGAAVDAVAGAAGAGDAATVAARIPLLTAASASYGAYIGMLAAVADAIASGAAVVGLAPAASAPAVHHAVDSDTDEEDESAARPFAFTDAAELYTEGLPASAYTGVHAAGGAAATGLAAGGGPCVDGAVAAGGVAADGTSVAVADGGDDGGGGTGASERVVEPPLPLLPDIARLPLWLQRMICDVQRRFPCDARGRPATSVSEAALRRARVGARALAHSLVEPLRASMFVLLPLWAASARG